MTFINKLKKLLGCKEEELQNRINILQKMINNEVINSPKVHSTASSSAIRAILYGLTDKLHISDAGYGLTSLTEAKTYCETSKVATSEYKLGKYDCDEYSFALMGHWNRDRNQFAFGICWSNTHAFNIMIDKDRKIWIIEPQSNKFIPIETAKKNSKYYPLRFIII